MDSKKKIEGNINTLSITPIYIEMCFNELNLASGTAFFVESEKGPVLITNRHNLTGRDQNTEQPLDKHCAIPNHIRFQIIGSHEPMWYFFDLYEDDDIEKPTWIEHPTFGAEVDVVGVLLSELKGTIHYFVHTKKHWLTPKVTDRIHVVGYPFGIKENFAIWSTGYIATEFAINYDKKPAFLIDCRTRKGQSGSLVLTKYNIGDIAIHKKKYHIAKQESMQYLGIYSGRINNDSDLGIVWKMEVVRDIIKKIETSKRIIDNKFSSHRYEQMWKNS